MSLVTSTKSYAKILSIDPSTALNAPGVVDFVSAKDVQGVNHMGIVMPKIFEDSEVSIVPVVIEVICW